MSDIKVLIEIPEGSDVKYELDEETGEMTVDRLMPAPRLATPPEDPRRPRE